MGHPHEVGRRALPSAPRTIWLPGAEPCPEVLTMADLVRFLRLDQTGVAQPEETVHKYRRRGLLRGAYFGTYIRFPLEEVLAFVRLKVEEEPR